MSGQIFISYRREESRWLSRSIYDRLVQRFGRNRVFMDVDTINPGVDFVDAIEKQVASCEVLIESTIEKVLDEAEAARRRRAETERQTAKLQAAELARRSKADRLEQKRIEENRRMTSTESSAEPRSPV